MYQIFVQMDGGEFMVVASRDQLRDAVQLVQGLNAYWPRQYVLRDSEGNILDLAGSRSTEAQSEPVTFFGRLSHPAGQKKSGAMRRKPRLELR